MSRYVPEPKALDGRWLSSLFERGERRVYRGSELETIGMPCGGICAGQLYVRGDGTLATWWLENETVFTGHGEAREQEVAGRSHPVGYQPEPYRPPSAVEQGFAIRVQAPGQSPVVRTLDRDGFDDIGFIGEYPVATVLYEGSSDTAFPVEVRAEVFSPFIPLDARSSATPATVFHFTVRNRTALPVKVSLAGWLERSGDLLLTCPRGVPTRWRSRENFLQKLLSRDPSALALAPEAGGQAGHVALVSTFEIATGETEETAFFITWYFPERLNDFPGCGHAVGNMYANWFGSAADVARYLTEDYQRLRRETLLFRDTFYDTSLPSWLIRRIGMPLANLATETFQWWRNGRFWAFEGVGCCFGTCGHVYNYAQAIAHLFPELERSVRLQQDIAEGLDPSTGRVGFRGVRGDSDQVSAESWGYAADAQCGYVLKLYREHLLSPDNSFLDTVWPSAKIIIENLIRRDADSDGVLEDRQHTTWDSDLYGPNGFIGSLYIAALRAAEAMARIEGEEALAERYRGLHESGTTAVLRKLWGGEYFIHLAPEDKNELPMCSQYGGGCLSDQLLGAAWAAELGLGRLYPREHITTTLHSIYRYNWTPDVGHDPAYPDVGPRHRDYPRIRLLALPGEAGLFVATWPHGGEPPNPIYHNAEVFTGTEYQVAAHMLSEGLLEEGLAILRGLHERYDPSRRNPWNEIECGDHYGRALASWSCLLGVTGFACDGPAGHLGFAPRLGPERFHAFFSAVEGWGSFRQERVGRTQVSTLEVRWGRVRLRTLALELPEGAKATGLTATAAGRPVEYEMAQEGKKVLLRFEREHILAELTSLRAAITW